MPGGFPEGWNICNGQSVGAAFNSPPGTPVTCGAANAKGSWTQLTASCPRDVAMIGLLVSTNVSNHVNVIDVAVGASGSEVIVVSNLLSSSSQCFFFIPLSIPAGSRISVRGQSSTAADTAVVWAQLFDASFTQMEGVAGYDSIGFSSATTLGTPFTPAGFAKSAWTQVIASTVRDYMGLMCSFDGQGTNAYYELAAIDIGLGASGSEVVLIPDIPAYTAGTAINGGNGFYPVDVPSGSRLSVRGAIAYNPPTMGATLYGAYK